MFSCPSCGFDAVPEGNACPLCGAKGVDVSDAPTLPLSSVPEAAPIVTTHAPGEVFAGRFRIEALLGQGGMGSVYRVTELPGGRPLALKILLPEAALDPQGTDRFRREAEILKRLDHPAIPAVHGFGAHEGELYLLTELIEGSDLKSEIRRRGAWPAGEAATVAATVAEALEVAHQHGVIHRDVKPHNVMLGTDGRVRLLDFGIARSVSSQMKTITKTDVVMGTPEYMSPEQLESHRVDARSDVYSLGIVLYELATGQLPFTGDTPLSVALKHRTELPAPPRSLRPEVPAWLERVILKCLEKDRGHRYQTAGELAAELRRPRGTGRTLRRRLPGGDVVLEDDSETTEFSLVLESAREKTGWEAGMALLFGGRAYRLEAAVPPVSPEEPWIYQLVDWPAEEVFRKVVDYTADSAERQVAIDGQLSTRLKRWLSGHKPG